jgi:hypothetical protein
MLNTPDTSPEPKLSDHLDSIENALGTTRVNLKEIKEALFRGEHPEGVSNRGLADGYAAIFAEKRWEVFNKVRAEHPSSFGLGLYGPDEWYFPLNPRALLETIKESGSFSEAVAVLSLNIHNSALSSLQSFCLQYQQSPDLCDSEYIEMFRRYEALCVAEGYTSPFYHMLAGETTAIIFGVDMYGVAQTLYREKFGEAADAENLFKIVMNSEKEGMILAAHHVELFGTLKEKVMTEEGELIPEAFELLEEGGIRVAIKKEIYISVDAQTVVQRCTGLEDVQLPDTATFRCPAHAAKGSFQEGPRDQSMIIEYQNWLRSVCHRFLGPYVSELSKQVSQL